VDQGETQRSVGFPRKSNTRLRVAQTCPKITRSENRFNVTSGCRAGMHKILQVLVISVQMSTLFRYVHRLLTVPITKAAHSGQVEFECLSSVYSAPSSAESSPTPCPNHPVPSTLTGCISPICGKPPPMTTLPVGLPSEGASSSAGPVNFHSVVDR